MGAGASGSISMAGITGFPPLGNFPSDRCIRISNQIVAFFAVGGNRFRDQAPHQVGGLIVINRCYGGFGLSLAAQRRYAELKGIGPLFFYKQTGYEHQQGKNEYTKIDGDGDDLFVFTLRRDLGPVVEEIPNDQGLWFASRYIERNDPALVQVIEEMGEEASGRCGKLEIVDIPDGVEWEIEEYDGNEWVSEKHRTWG